MKEKGLMMSMEKSEPGLCESRSGVPKASAFSSTHEGGRGSVKVVGVLIGKTADVIAGEHMYEQHHVCSNAFGPPPTQRRRATNTDACLSQQDRLGFHTFRRGDLARYVPVQEGESYAAT
eukprot:6174995-Pleurochrysis_carterae.AAC.1